MRNDLHGLAEVVSAPFLLEDVFVYLPGGQVVEFAKLAVGEAFVVAEVEVGFRAVVEDIDFAVLEWAHRAGIHVQIRVEFLYSYFKLSGFQQCAEGARGEPLAQR